jgi:hypothetical protein
MVGADPHPRMPITDNPAIALTITDIIGRTFFMGSFLYQNGSLSGCRQGAGAK